MIKEGSQLSSWINLLDSSDIAFSLSEDNKSITIGSFSNHIENIGINDGDAHASVTIKFNRHGTVICFNICGG